MSIQPPFFDPSLALLQRQSAFDTQTGVADLRLQGERMQEDQNLFRPFLQRRFKRQARQQADSVAGRGFHGSQSGIMRTKMGELGEDQAYAMGEFERGSARGLTDIERAIGNLTQRNIMTVGEGTRTAAGSASQRVMPQYIPF